MKYILLILSKTILTIVVILLTILVFTVGQILYVLWESKLEWISDKVNFIEIDCNDRHASYKRKDRIYKNIFYWLFNGRYLDFY